MARLLIERETIFTEEVDMLMDGKSVEEIMAFMDENERALSENPFLRGQKKAKPVKEETATEIKAEETPKTKTTETAENTETNDKKDDDTNE